MIRYIDELNTVDLKGKRVLLRVDLNVPILNGEVLDTFRLEKVIETVDFLREKEARVIIISHCEGEESKTLVPMWHYLNGYFPVEFCPTFFTPEAIDKLLNLKDKGVLLFENVRINEGEKANDPEFSKKLSAMADIYVNDAFAVSHRKHASIVGVPDFLPHFGGLLMRQEIENLSRAFTPARPFLFILGGAKFNTKVPLIKKYLEKADSVYICGALADNFFKAKGMEVGKSLVDENDFGISEFVKNPKLILPVDVIVSKPDLSTEVKAIDKVLKDEAIIDIGPESVQQVKKMIFASKTLVWNGPLGKYKKGFQDSTAAVSEIISEATETIGVESIIGGGDTIASINMLELNQKFTFISTGGGAMLDFLVNETLPGIDSLQK